eukprot:m.86111 g.86111  ORF g.86111 m.86111 type:complete len:55 (-) comp16372_c0_seq12:17-181(-)
MGGHGGSDFYLMDAFVQAIRTGDHSLVRIAGTHATLVHCRAGHQSQWFSQKLNH